MYGVLADPGASHSLIGIETLWMLAQQVIWPSGRDLVHDRHSTKKVSGIEGKPEKAGGTA